MQKFKIDNIPCVLYGDSAEKIILYVHGKCGYKEEAKGLEKIAGNYGYQVIGIDLPGHGERKNEMDNFTPWCVIPELRKVLDYLKKHYKVISLRANSIGAYFSLLAFSDYKFDKCIMVSPILDMKKLIENIMQWQGVTLDELRKKETIETSFGETLSYRYYEYVVNHPTEKWDSETYILYAGKDNMTSRQTVDDFVNRFDCKLTVMENGEHFFHTDEQLSFQDKWIENILK